MKNIIKFGISLSLYFTLNILRATILIISTFALYANARTKNSRGIVYSVIGFILFIIVSRIIQHYY